MTLLRDVPSYGVYFASYELCLRALGGDRNDSPHRVASVRRERGRRWSTVACGGAHAVRPCSVDARHHKILAAGGVAGSVSWTMIYPLDVVKSRVQTQPIGGPPLYSGPLSGTLVEWPSNMHPDQPRRLLTTFFVFAAGMLDCFRKSIQYDGWRVLFRVRSTFRHASACLCVLTLTC